MALKTGTHLGGVHNLESLRQRCVIDPETGCWHLRRPDGARLRASAREVPAIHVFGVGRRSARRAAVEFSKRHELPPTTIVAACEKAFDCVNPRHLRCCSCKIEHGALMVARGRVRTPAKTLACQRSARHRRTSKLTIELAGWARESPQRQEDVAHALDVGQSLVSDIRRGRAWAEPLPLGSIFALGAST